jgi:hypothetical protein
MIAVGMGDQIPIRSGHFIYRPLDIRAPSGNYFTIISLVFSLSRLIIVHENDICMRGCLIQTPHSFQFFFFPPYPYQWNRRLLKVRKKKN